MLALILSGVLLQTGGEADQAKLREAFAREFKDNEPQKRIQALQLLFALTEEKSILALAEGLRDPDAQVRKAAARVIGSCTDLSGAAAKPLCQSLLNRKEDKDVRTACARALSRSPYKTEALDALVQVFVGIGEDDKDLRDLRAQCLETINYLGIQDFAAGKDAAEKVRKWWTDHKPRFVKDDQEKRGLVQKPVKGK